MGEHGAVGQEQGVEGVPPVHRERRAAHHDVLSVERTVRLGDERVGGEGGEGGGGGESRSRSKITSKSGKHLTPALSPSDAEREKTPRFGKDAFHRAPFWAGEITDAVERVPTNWLQVSSREFMAWHVRFFFGESGQYADLAAQRKVKVHGLASLAGAR